MNLNFKPSENERPLDNLLTHGGYAGIFRTIACIGDSLSSGEFEGTAADGTKTYHDLYEYSWGQYLARMAGCKVYNFSCGGMSARWYLNSFADERGLWNRDLAAQAYIVAMGCNDIYAVDRGEIEMGTMDDINFETGYGIKRSFIGDYATMLQKYREIAPDAFFFLMTMPRFEDDQYEALRDEHRRLLFDLAQRLPNTFVIDLREEAPVYDAEFKRNFFLGGHLNPMGYMLTAQMVATYIDYIVRSDMPRFKQVGFINTPWKNAEE